MLDEKEMLAEQSSAGAVLRAVFARRLPGGSSVLHYLGSACWDGLMCLLQSGWLYCLCQTQRYCGCRKNAPCSRVPLTNPERSVELTCSSEPKTVLRLQPLCMAGWAQEIVLQQTHRKCKPGERASWKCFLKTECNCFYGYVKLLVSKIRMISTALNVSNDQLSWMLQTLPCQ